MKRTKQIGYETGMKKREANTWPLTRPIYCPRFELTMCMKPIFISHQQQIYLHGHFKPFGRPFFQEHCQFGTIGEGEGVLLFTVAYWEIIQNYFTRSFHFSSYVYGILTGLELTLYKWNPEGSCFSTVVQTLIIVEVNRIRTTQVQNRIFYFIKCVF